MPNETDVIAAKVRGVAGEHRLTQKRVAEMVGLSRTAIADRYQARVPWTAPEVLKLARALDEPVARFFPDERAHR